MCVCLGGGDFVCVWVCVHVYMHVCMDVLCACAHIHVCTHTKGVCMCIGGKLCMVDTFNSSKPQ